MSKAFIQKPAPHFQGTAVTASGDFKDIKLSDYKGMFKIRLMPNQAALLISWFCHVMYFVGCPLLRLSNNLKIMNLNLSEFIRIGRRTMKCDEIR